MIQTLRDAAADSQEEGIRFELNLSAAALEYAIKQFCANPTEELLREMTGEWSHGLRMIQKSKDYNSRRNGRLGLI